MKQFYKILISVIVLFSFHSVKGQNKIIIGQKEINTGTSFDLPILLENTDAITAIQFDINFDATVLN